MHHFCTYFDSGYLVRGLALYRSLERHVPHFTLHIFCLDDITYDVLMRAELAAVVPIRLVDLEAFDRELLAARGRRSQVEYYFTMTSVLPKFLFEAFPELNIVTYIDADLLFFSDPEPIFNEIGDASVGITPHRFTQANQELSRFGIYNVGWLTWRRDSRAQDCREWYRTKSLEWCSDVVEDDRYADQKYLDEWTTHFPGVHSIHHKGANLAPWNNGNYQFSLRQEQFYVDDDPLIFYHFHGLKSLYELDPEQTSVKWYLHGPAPFDFDLLMNAVYQPYVNAMCAAREELKVFNLPGLSNDRQIRHTDAPPLAATSGVWRHEIDWQRADTADEALWEPQNSPLPNDRMRSLTVRAIPKHQPEFDGGYFAHHTRIELLIHFASVFVNRPLAIVDCSESEELIDHAFEVMPRIADARWTVVASAEIFDALHSRLPNILSESDFDTALVQSPDIVITGSSVARSQDWQGAIHRLATQAAWLLLEMRTFSGTPTSLATCRDIGAKTPLNYWIINRNDLTAIFDRETITIVREIVLPDPARIPDIPEIADRRLFLLSCGSRRNGEDLS